VEFFNIMCPTEYCCHELRNNLVRVLQILWRKIEGVKKEEERKKIFYRYDSPYPRCEHMGAGQGANQSTGEIGFAFRLRFLWALSRFMHLKSMAL
jgi:hypothetical protein